MCSMTESEVAGTKARSSKHFNFAAKFRVGKGGGAHRVPVYKKTKSSTNRKMTSTSINSCNSYT